MIREPYRGLAAIVVVAALRAILGAAFGFCSLSASEARADAAVVTTTGSPSPVVATSLNWSTFLGGTSQAWDIAVDDAGYVYVVGSTSSPSFPTTPGAYDESHNGNDDAFVAKLDPSGSTLLYATFLGGTETDFGATISVDATGCAYVAGTTESLDFPTTPSAYDTSLNGGRDVFVAKLDPNGTALVYSTFLGGPASEWMPDLSTDDLGNAYVVGSTPSTDFPTTQGAFQTTAPGGGDAFVLKLNASGSALVFSTFLGGSQGEVASGYKDYGIAVDADGDVYVTGSTGSSDFPTTPGAFDESHNGWTDIFVTKLNGTGTALIFSTFLGAGSGGPNNREEYAHSIVVDGAGNVLVAGQTQVPSFPTTGGAFQRSFGGATDVFVTKFDATGTSLLYSTFLGGSSSEWLRGGLAVGPQGEAYVMGITHSADFPVTADGYDQTYGGNWDCFLAQLSSSGSILLYSSFLGGWNTDEGKDLVLGSNGKLYLAGLTLSQDFPTTPGAYDPDFNCCTYDAFVMAWSPFVPASLRVTAQVREVGDSGPFVDPPPPLEGATVRLIQGAVQSMPVVTDASGLATFLFRWELAIGGQYEIELYGPKAHVRAHWRDELHNPENTVTAVVDASSTGPRTDYTWPHAGSAIDQAPAIQAAYFITKVRRDFWEHSEPAFGVLWNWQPNSRESPATTDEAIVIIYEFDRELSRNSGALACCGYKVIKFLGPLKTAEDANTIYHEFAHNVIADIFAAAPNAGGPRWIGVRRTNDNPSGPPSSADQGWAMDEALADYFAATFTGDPTIGKCAWYYWPPFGPGCGSGESTRSYRDLRKVFRLPTDRSYSMEPHEGSVFLAGALWDLRETIGAVTTNYLVRSALQHMIEMASSGTEFSFTDFYWAMRAADGPSPFDGQHLQQIDQAFQAHNLTPSPTPYAAVGWQDDDAFHNLQPADDHIAFSWRPAPNATRYQLRVSSVNYDFGMSLATFITVADSITDTTYVYPGREPRTEYLFAVVGVDDSGQPGYMSAPVYVAALDTTVVDTPQFPIPPPSGGQWLFNSPNPFNPETKMTFELGGPDVVVLTIYDVAGHLIRSFPGKRYSAGVNDIRWNGQDDKGRHMPSGLYCVTLQGSLWKDRGKVLLLK